MSNTALSLVLAHAESEAPPRWRTTLSKLVGQVVSLELACRRGRGQYMPRAKAADVLVTDETADELAMAAREFVRGDGVKSSDFALSIRTSDKKIRRLDPVRIVSGDDCISEEEPVDAGAVAASAATSALVAVLAKENAALRDQNAVLIERLIDSHARFGQVIIDQGNARSVEQSNRGVLLHHRESQQSSSSSSGAGSVSSDSVADHWWQSEPCCDLLSTGIENVSSLAGLIGVALAGGKST